ncbi:MAG: sulfite exporter TauE/SafE family protein [Pseudomonadota bacterium]
MELLTYLLTGAAAGLLAGLLGVGGGLVIVPALAWLLAGHGVADTHLMHLAVGTSLAAIIPTALSSLLAHHRRGSVHWPAVAGLLPGILVGALGGAWLARHASSPVLAVCFGVFEILVALQLFFALKPVAHRSLPGRAGLVLAGVLIGTVSALLGIGGGTLTTPFLLWNGIDIRRAVGTSASCGLPIALAGAAGFAWSGRNLMADQAWTTGFIYWPAVFGIVLASVPVAPFGARLAHRLPRARLQRVFALFLLLVGGRMLLSA